MRRARSRGFTLIELMIAVAIVSVLAALALTGFQRFQLRTKTAEARSNLATIATTEHAYHAEYSGYLAAAATPPGPLGANRRAWAGGGAAAFDQLGFVPTADPYFSYAVEVDPTGSFFTAVALGDLDGNTTPSEFGYVHPLPGAAVGLTSTVAPGCSGNGTFSPNGPMLSTVGPCTAFDGTSRF